MHNPWFGSVFLSNLTVNVNRKGGGERSNEGKKVKVAGSAEPAVGDPVFLDY